MKIIIFDPLELDFRSHVILKVTRISFSGALYKSNSGAGRASWREPCLDAKLARNLQNHDFSDFKFLQCEIRKFVWALTLGERYFKILSVEWFKSQAPVKQRAGEFNSFSLSYERTFFMKIRKIMKLIIFELLELDFRSCVTAKVTRGAVKL
mgnify:CR=1 FL=1